MTKKKIRKGDSDFKNIVANNGYFVDKTMLIQEFYDNEDHVLLIPRPRRFGKTLNLSMIEHFFDISKKDSAGLFYEFKISKEKEFCTNHQNKYPVINISLKSIRADDWEGCLQHLKVVISDTYKSHKYLLRSEKLEHYEKQSIEKIILRQGSQSDFEFSLKNLSGYLETHFENETITLVDEYDTPVIAGYVNKYYRRIIFINENDGFVFKVSF